MGLIAGLTTSTYASDWSGSATTGWSSNLDPGWNGTGVPNAIGATANYAGATSATTTQDIAAGVTVGTISFGGSSAAGWSIPGANTALNTITLNQDGAGGGVATISNTNTSATITNALVIGSTTASANANIVLADDVTFSNTGNSTNTFGSIQVIGKISGTGNLTFSNVTNSTTAGFLRVQTGVNTFTGSVLIQKGATTYNKAEAFGNVSTNLVTLGQSGQGSATLISTAGVVLPNNVVVAAGSVGTLILGSSSTANNGYSGTLTLNGNLTATSATTGTATLTLSNSVSGAGAFTKVGAGSLTLSGPSNSYGGGTTVTAGKLVAGNSTALGTGAVLISGGTLDLNGVGAVNLTLGTGSNFTLASGATLALTLNDSIVGVGGLFSVNGVLDLTGSTFAAGSYTIFTGFTSGSGTFTNIVTGNGGFAASFDDTTTPGLGVLTITAVPEPHEYALAVAGLLGVVIFMRRRKDAMTA